MLELTLLPKYFEYIKSKVKTVEGRVNTDKFKKIKVVIKLLLFQKKQIKS